MTPALGRLCNDRLAAGQKGKSLSLATCPVFRVHLSSFARDFAIWSPYVTIGLFNTVMFAGAAAGLGHYGLSGSLMNTILGVSAAFIIRLQTNLP